MTDNSGLKVGLGVTALGAASALQLNQWQTNIVNLW